MTRLTAVSDPRALRPLVAYGWDDSGNLVSTTDADGLVTTFVPDIDGRPREERRPDGSIVRYEYRFGALSEQTVDARGPSPVTTTLDPARSGLPERGVGPWGEETRWTWSRDLARLESVERRNDGDSETTRFIYNGFGQARETSNGLLRTLVSYDVQGMPSRVSQYALDGSVSPYPESGLIDPAVHRTEGGGLPGAVTCTRFGPDGRVLERVLPEGTRLRYTYDGEGRIKTVEGGSLSSDGSGWDRGCPLYTGGRPETGVLQAIEYDVAGRPQKVTDARGKTTTIAYDGYGNPVAVTDPVGTVTRRGFDELGNVVWEAVYAVGAAPAEYRKFAVTDTGLLAARQLFYDNAGRLSETREQHFDKDGVTVGDGVAVTKYAYDLRRRELRITNDAGHLTVRQWDGAGRPSQVRYPTGGTETWEYSDAGRLTRHGRTAPTREGVVFETLRVTSWGAPAVLIENPPPRIGSGFLANLIRFLSEILRGDVPVPERVWTYDRFRRLDSEREVGGLVRTYTYDALGRRKSETSPYEAGKPAELVTFGWDRAGLLLAHTSEFGPGTAASTLYDYDALGRLRQVDRPEGVVEMLEYDGVSGLVARRQDGRGVVFKHAYTDAGLLTVLRAFRVGDATSLPPPGGGGLPGPAPLAECGIRSGADCQVRKFTYDGLGRMREATNVVLKSVTSGGRTTVERRDDVTTKLAWDSLSNKTDETNTVIGGFFGVSHIFNGLGQPETSFLGAESVGYAYDSIGRMVDVTPSGQTTSVVHFDYAGLGGPTKRTLKSGVVTTYGYDLLGRLESMSDAGSTPLASWRWELPADGVPRVSGFRRGREVEVSSLYEVDRAGRLLWEGLGARRMEALNVDPTAPREAANQLVTLAARRSAPASERRYDLDGRHNWKSLDASDDALDATPAINKLDAYTQFRDETATYSGGFLSSVGTGEGYTYNLMGEPEKVRRNGVTKRYLNDALGRVVRESDEEGSGGSTIEFGWDGPRRLVVKKLTGTEVTVPGQGLDEHLLLLRRQGAIILPPGCGLDCPPGGPVAAAVRAGAARIAAGDIDQPLPIPPQTAYYHQDRAGSVYMLSNSTGQAIEYYDYTAYGEITIRKPDGRRFETSEVGNTFGFQGHPTDLDLGLVRMRARIYKPDWGRFTTLDPIGLAGGSNLLAFTFSAPLKYTDPLGLAPQRSSQAESISSSVFRAAGSLFAGHLGATIRPGPSDPFGLSGQAISQAASASGAAGRNAGAAVFGGGVAGSAAGVAAVAGGIAMAPIIVEEVGTIAFAARMLAATRPGWVAFGTAVAAGEGGVMLPLAVSPARVAGAGGGWRVFKELADPRVVQQFAENACGPACGQMLLRQAGVEVLQGEIARAAGGALTTAETLAAALNTLQPVATWAGGMIERTALQAASRTGSFAAMLWEGGRRVGHWVVVDSIENGMVGIRDPAHATSYVMRLHDFLEAWTQIVVIRR